MLPKVITTTSNYVPTSGNVVAKSYIPIERVDMGMWDQSVTYSIDNIVMYGWYKYLCTNTSKNVMPSVTPNWKTYWTLLDGVENTPKGIGSDRLGSVLQLKAN